MTTTSNRGDGPYTHGPGTASSVSDWQQDLLIEVQETIWKHMP